MNPQNPLPTVASSQQAPHHGSGLDGGAAVLPLPLSSAVPSTAPLAAPGAPLSPGPPSVMAPPTSAPWLEPPVPVQPSQKSEPPSSASDTHISNVAPAVADDGDLIEKEWVMAAKQVVDRTRTDPHAQTKQMHALRADYMKKRYNKVIEPVNE